MKKKAAEMSVFETTMADLEGSIAHSKGNKVSLVTKHIYEPDPSVGGKAVSKEDHRRILTTEHAELHGRSKRRIDMDEQDKSEE